MSQHPVMYKSTDLKSDVLDRIWQDWNCREWRAQLYETHYTSVVRSTSRATAFEDWLYDQGAYVVQKNRKRFIRFHDDERAVMFMLRYT